MPRLLRPKVPTARYRASIGGTVTAAWVGAAAALAGCASQSFDAQFQQVYRQAMEQQREQDEVERLKRVGRFDEAEKLARRIDAREAAQQGRKAGDDTRPSLTEGVQNERQRADIDERLLVTSGEPLCTRPIWLSVFVIERPSADPEAMAANAEQAMQRQEALAQVSALASAGDMAAARSRGEQLLADARRRSGPAASATMEVLFHLAGIEAQAGNRDAAIARYRESAAAAEQAGRRDWLASFVAGEGGLLLDAGDAAGALAAARRVQALTAGGDPAAHAAALNNVGVALLHRRDAGGAVDALRAAQAEIGELPTRVSLLDMMNVAKTATARPVLLSNLALLRRQQGDAAEALARCREALDARAATDDYGAPDGLPEKAALARAAALAAEMDPIVALEAAVPPAAGTAAAPAAGAVVLPTGLSMLLERKGAVLERQQRAMEAVRASAAAVAALSGGPGTTPGSAASPMPGAASSGAPASMLLLPGQSAAGRGGSTPQMPFAMGGMGSINQIMQQAQAMQQQRQREENRDLVEQYEAALAERATLESETPSETKQVEAHERRKADVDRRIRVMQREITERGSIAARDAGAPLQIDPAALMRGDVQSFTGQIENRIESARSQRTTGRAELPARVRAAIPERAVLVEMFTIRPPLPSAADAPHSFAFGKQYYAAYLVRREGAVALVRFGEVEVIDRAIVELRKALADPRSRDGARQAGRRLDAMLGEPMRRAAPGATAWYVAPDGNLNLLPFGALVDEGGRFLVETHSFNYLASGRGLLNDGARPRARAPALIVADPSFETAAAPAATAGASSRSLRSTVFRSLRFDPLPGTAEEAVAIKKVMPEAVVLASGAATESAVKRTRAPRVLHLATHGFFFEQADRPDAIAREKAENPMLRSGLVFAGVNQLASGQDDGVLTALEAAGLDLVGTQLVVMSACETGLGDVKNGEGVFGLRRAFAAAGAESLVMSLWPVEDTATQKMMSEYYRLLAAGGDRVDALRQAQLALMADPKLRHPFFWAAFIASGQGGPLRP